MKIAFGVIGALIGTAFGLISAVALVELTSARNTLGEAFLFFIVAPLGLLSGAIGGAIGAIRSR